jgi:hypothetical protein
MKVVINSEEELIDKFKESVHILNNLRHFTKIWQDHYGAGNNFKRVYWQEKADKFLDSLDASKTRSKEQIKIINSNTTK